ncbi:hypothetical protein XBFFL1_2460003 [Xenorhabdus bovienii str. feltiae Florida]|nr:hypothetical protein XBFFR1_1480002 [Xenorhabdus bovienii str. feltiae France]CDG93271.1 hypothetical protein XBFFL1_2460003 [Xenorhabdus bovienii str. feltiae Florida]
MAYSEYNSTWFLYVKWPIRYVDYHCENRIFPDKGLPQRMGFKAL